MGKLYIANCTKQQQDFVFTLPESAAHRMRTIDVGSQICIDRLNEKDVEAIIEHHAKYGMVSAAEARKARGFVGLCYQEDQPIKLDTQELVIQHNDDVLFDRGRQMREEAAVATAQSVDGQGSGLKAVTTEVREEVKDGGQGLEETVRVDKGADGRTDGKAAKQQQQNASRK